MADVIPIGRTMLRNAEFRIRQVHLDCGQMTVTFSTTQPIPDHVLASIKHLDLGGSVVAVAFKHRIHLTDGVGRQHAVFMVEAMFSPSDQLDACVMWFDEGEVEVLNTFSA